MKKKTFALFLAVITVLSMCPFALAADGSLDSRLTNVTKIVKDTVKIGDDYTDFHGDLNDNGADQYWSLVWSKETETLSIMADENGKIFSYSRNNDNFSRRYSDDFAPAFPKVSRGDAQKAAEAFLKLVLAKNESCVFENIPAVGSAYDADSYYFSGDLYTNGLAMQSYISISVNTKDLSIAYFNRGDMYMNIIGSLPSAEASVTKDAAFASLSGTVKMNLQYVLDDINPKNASAARTAVLRYLPASYANYVVDAKTGKLINLDDLYSGITATGKGGSEMGATDQSKAINGSTLTDTEREGISKLKGVLSKDQLDAKARAMTELGLLPDFTLNSVDYSLNNETGEVTANLSYTKKTDVSDAKGSAGSTSAKAISQEKINLMIAAGETFYTYKNVTVDAKTGALKSVYTNYPYSADYSSVKKDDAKLQAKAAAFLEKYYNGYYKKSARYEGSGDIILYSAYNIPSVSYTYAQSENGYFFPSNSMYVSVNAETGYIDSFSLNWTENVTFESPDGIIASDKAASLYASAFETRLSYVLLPVAIDPSRPEMKKYIDRGYSYVYEYRLGYTPYTAESISGINAKTGEVIKYQPSLQKPVEYTDIADSFAKAQIEKLAQYGIGFPGKSFQPKKQLTQLDMVVLLMSADGYRIDNENMSQDEIDSVYNAAYYRHILKKEDKNPSKAITRSDLIRTLLTMSGYDKTANLKGIYTCHFTDAASIKAADYGYFAIAQGLGILRGDAKGNVNPYAVVTRQEFAAMFYNFMSR